MQVDAVLPFDTGIWGCWISPLPYSGWFLVVGQIGRPTRLSFLITKNHAEQRVLR